MGFGKVIKCENCDMEYDIYLGESEEKVTETAIVCTICGSFGNKSDLVGKETKCCGKNMEELHDFGEFDKKIKKFRCPQCGKRKLKDTEELFSW